MLRIIKRIKYIAKHAFVALFAIVSFTLAANAISATNFSPADNATGITASDNLVITFDEQWTGYCGTNLTIYQANGNPHQVFDFSGCSSPAGISGDGSTTLTINPTSDFDDGASYYVQIGDWTVIDSMMSNYYAISDSTTWNFTIAAAVDVTPPSVTSFSPVDNTTLASISDNLVITFDEAVDVESGNITIYKTTGDVLVEAIDVTGGLVSGTGTNTITINPTADFDIETEYYVLIDANAFDDASSNSYAGIASKTTWNFTTTCDQSSDPADWYHCAWDNRIKITVDASKVNGDLSNFPVYVDLSDFNDVAGFFENVSSTGADIRVTKADGLTEVAREVVSISSTNNAGELHFVANGTLSGTSNSDWYLYYNCSAATEPSASATYGKNNVWANSYIGVWHMQEDPNGDASNVTLDSTSYAHDGTPAGSMTSADLVAAMVGNGYDFDGGNDYVSIGSSTDYDFGSADFSISAWMKTDQPNGSRQLIVARDDSSSQRQFGLEYDSNNDANNNIAIVYFKAGASYVNLYSPANPITDSNWHHIQGQRISNSFNLYIDGALSASGTTVGSHGTAFSSSSTLRIGSRGYPSSESYFDGMIDEVRIASGYKSADWVVSMYNNQNSPSTFYSLGDEEDQVDTTDPTVNTFSPADNATGVAVDANLVITFDEAVDVESGNITIKKTTGDTLVEAIDVTGLLVTGTGTNTITINPTADLEGSTEYYVLIDATAFDDAASNSYAGIASTTAWSFTTTATTPDPWSNSAWAKRIKITVDATKVNGDVTDFPVYVDLSDLDSVDFFSFVNSDGSDIRVTQGDGLTLLPTELVSLDLVNNAGELWFKAPLLSATTDTDFYIYYNNNNVTTLNADHPLGKHAVWSNGFVAVYHMNEDPNGDTSYAIQNSVSNAYHGSPSGTMTSADHVAGQIGNGTDFDGSDDYINFGDHSGVDFGSSNFEFSIWAKHDNTGNQGHIFGKDSNTNGRQFEFRTDGSGGIVFSYWKSGAVQVYKNQSSVLNDTNWHYISLMKRSSSFEIYKDGSKIGSGTTSGTHGSMQSTNAPLFLGRREYAGFTEEFDGKFDEARIAAKAHSDDWIETEYNNQNSPSTFYTVAGSIDNSTDTDNPQISSRYPRNRSDRFPLAANLFIDFNKNIQKGTGNITIMDTNGSTFETIAVASTTVSGTRITINPSSNLLPGTNYYVLIDTGAIEDTSANDFAGISTSIGWSFTTEDGKSTINTPFNMFMHGE